MNILIHNIAFWAADLTQALVLLVSCAACDAMGNGWRSSHEKENKNPLRTYDCCLKPGVWSVLVDCQEKDKNTHIHDLHFTIYFHFEIQGFWLRVLIQYCTNFLFFFFFHCTGTKAQGSNTKTCDRRPCDISKLNLIPDNLTIL